MANPKKGSKITKEPIKIDLKAEPKFEIVRPLLSVPLEITRDALRVMNMVDENIIISDYSRYIKQDCE